MNKNRLSRRNFLKSSAAIAAFVSAGSLAYSESPEVFNNAPVSPLKIPGWRRGHLHQHSFWSDGSATLEEAATRTLFFTLRVSETGAPHSLALSAAGAGDAFAALVASPPAWMFSRDWDAVRLTVRGVDEQAENVSVQFNADPWVLIMR